ncbi:MAG TPA: hypothetical protein VJ652_16130 [Noviherbaspirillum sp.]|nr:hypothetical protein [Noviherbaspirillum sp.]
MKKAGPAIILFLLLALLAAGSAWAHRHFNHWHPYPHAHLGIVIGAPFGPPVHYRPPILYAYPPIIAVPAPPPVYIEQSGAQQDLDDEPEYWWYYCPLPQGYYPYVQRCPAGWKRVAPQPPDLQ